ncbi:metallophosphatase family protein [Solirubrobacter ginsenosidimutans]|uniref:Metallophosphatase family protein n=1 Tax=Solirubrobacter ginsenosidimutans TaxID=490573 RepID=A0A9X3MYA6_9ACTN|nr:metallophosphoesterase family protein [Solirubrobacter ginsenosidimutans]MDA0164772.1 metallophosphatase family protein [Solirubrobacter ginsenosidimutans]
MNVLALYDIHGNIDALEAVLADPRAADPDVVVVGGDVVPGPFARATLERLSQLNARWLRGNGEREVAEAIDGPEPAPDDLARVTAKLTLDEIGPDAARPLGDLPLTLEIDGVLYCHATPRRDDEMVTKLSTPERWAEVLSTTTAPLVVAGHTHQQHDRTVGATRFINAGSVGLPYEGDGAARWLWVADGVPELRQTAYDSHAAGRRMLAAWPDARSLNASLVEPVAPLTVTEIFESLI